MKKNKALTKVGDLVQVDMETGEAVPVEGGGLRMLPPAPGKCQDCAVAHEPENPHDNQSLYWQMKFHAIHKRWPTWTDAMAHCTPEVQAVWRRDLVERMRQVGMEVPPDLADAS